MLVMKLNNICLFVVAKLKLIFTHFQVLIYEYNVPGKGTKDDIFQDFKNQAVSLTKIYQKDDNRVAWVSIKLPYSENRAIEEALLYFAVADIAVRKFNSDSLILIGSPEMEIRTEYLNRVTFSLLYLFSPCKTQMF